MMRAQASRESTVARSARVLSRLFAQSHVIAGNTNKRKETHGVVGDQFSKVASGRDVKRRNEGDKNGDLDGRERNKKKRGKK